MTQITILNKKSRVNFNQQTRCFQLKSHCVLLTDAALFFRVESSSLQHQRRIVERNRVVSAEVAPLLVGGVSESSASESARLVAKRFALALAGRELQLVHRDDRVVRPRVVPAVGQGCQNANSHSTF